MVAVIGGGFGYALAYLVKVLYKLEMSRLIG